MAFQYAFNPFLSSTWFYFGDIMVAYLRSFRCLAKHKYAPSLYGDMLLSYILTVTFEWFVLKEIFFAQK
jgi:hypothetical protein